VHAGAPVVFAMDRAGLVGEDGPTHHGVFDIAFCRHIPNLIMMAPSDENELADMLFTAITSRKPCVIRYPRAHGLGVQLKKEPEVIPFRAQLINEGDDIVIIAIGSMVEPARQASQLLAQEGFSVAVVNARYIKPLDKEILAPVAAKTGLVVTVEEGILAGGFGSAVLELFQDEGLTDVKVSRLGIPDKFIEHGTRQELLEDLGLSASGIAHQCKKMIGSSPVRKHLRVNVGS
jgi:1-deoxy-D-xylulose-5-phosphate synthase